MLSQTLLIVGSVLAWVALIVQVVLLWRDGEKLWAVLCGLFWPIAILMAMMRTDRLWLTAMMGGGLVMVMVGFAIK